MIDRLTNLVWRVQYTPVLDIRYTLDLLGHVTQRVDRSGGAVLAVRDYGYDGLDRLASEAHASGYAATYAYDDAGRRTAKETARFGVAYTAGTGDRLAGWEVTRTNTWTFQVSGFSSEAPATNPAYRFLEVRNDVETVAPGMTGSNFTAALTARTLDTQTVIVAISDAAGNVGVATSSFVRTAFTAGEYHADAAGCVTQAVWRGPLCERSLTLAWDASYRLTAAATNGAPAESYGYDPSGTRVWTEAGGVTNFYLYDGPHLLADLDATGGVFRSYVYGPEIDELIAMTIHTGDVPRTYYALRDHQNTVWAWVDESGDVAESYDYDAWGRLLGIYNGAGASVSDQQSPIGNRFLFQGREYSWASGLYHFRARWYDPVTGRWLSNDPIGISGGLNQYAFCGNDPVNYTDPLGLCEGGEQTTSDPVGLGGDTPKWWPVWRPLRPGDEIVIVNAVVPFSVSIGMPKVGSVLGKGYPTKINIGGKLQPYNPANGQYLPYSSNPGLVRSPFTQFVAGFGQGYAEAKGASYATPVGRSGSIGHMLGSLLGSLL